MTCLEEQRLEPARHKLRRWRARSCLYPTPHECSKPCSSRFDIYSTDLVENDGRNAHRGECDAELWKECRIQCNIIQARKHCVCCVTFSYLAQEHQIVTDQGHSAQTRLQVARSRISGKILFARPTVANSTGLERSSNAVRGRL